jgi:hypothetical protein
MHDMAQIGARATPAANAIRPIWKFMLSSFRLIARPTQVGAPMTPAAALPFSRTR